MELEEIIFINGLEMKASRAVWRSFRVNRYELNMLCAVYAYLALQQRKVISINKLFQWIGMSGRLKGKFRGYIQGLLNKGCLHLLQPKRWAHKPAGCVALSPFGSRVLDAFYAEVTRLEREQQQRNGIKNTVTSTYDPGLDYSFSTPGRA